jgi:flagellar protein FliS
MMNENGYQQYKQQSVMTMTQGELLILLYDEFIKRLKRSDLALDEKNYVLFDQSVQRCLDIVKYLRDTLNFQYEISRQLATMYEFFSFELYRLKAGRNKKVVQELEPLVKELRDAFAEAEKNV